MTATFRALRVVSDAVLTLGLVLLLFAAYLLWWTNHSTRAQARHEVHRLEEEWGRHGEGAAHDSGGHTQRSGPRASGRTAPSGNRRTRTATAPPSPSRTYAILRIPRLGLTTPIAEGVDKLRVLDRGFIGHYPGTAQPGETGNLALAAHRNTHGEPFRHLDRMRPGDTVTASTADGDFRYRIDQVLPRTSPGDALTIAAVPTTSRPHRGVVGYARPGRYITLTTCTPDFSSRYRMVVWGSLLENR
ncbi:class E sortase [Streptomyces sp. NPDC005435]|uniref:class E sortase n=1 Tax=Streptomyces sp. NPDC005435 TaxID=3154464 RepID=UPI0034555F46